MHNFHRLHSHLVAARFETWPFNLVDPRVLDAPTHYIFALLIHENDRSIAAIRNSIHYVGVPIPQLSVLCIASLERDVGVLAQSHQLAYGERYISPFAIVRCIAVA